MQIMDLSYALNNEILPLKYEGVSFNASIQIFTEENVYTVKPGSLLKNGNTYTSNKILWGDSELVDNSFVNFDIEKEAKSLKFTAKTQLNRNIYGFKLRFDDLPLGKLLTLTEKDIDITEYGHLFRYPEGWRELSTPLLVFQLENKKFLYIRVRHDKVIPISFYLKKTASQKMRVEITIDQRGHELSKTFNPCPIEMGISDNLEDIYLEQNEHLRTTFNLVDYKTNPNVPKWMKDVSLVVIMHMEAFTGHIFHTYKKALEDIKALTKYIDGKRILVYIAGWEGRYYYKYGNYTPDDRLGGEIGLKEMVDGMHELGAHVLAMYGMNMANATLFSKEQVTEMEFVTSRGGRFHKGSVDWEGSHCYDSGFFTSNNPGRILWQDYLFNQIKESSLRFNFDGAFLDIAACYVNDLRTPVYEGLTTLCNRLRTIKPEFLISGEGYYDALSKIIPLFQSGHTDGRMNYHDRVSPLLFNCFSREFSHLCLGDLSRGSSGVHELGTNDDVKTPLREALIPTLTLVEDTVEKALDKIKDVLKDANTYAERYL